MLLGLVISGRNWCYSVGLNYPRADIFCLRLAISSCCLRDCPCSDWFSSNKLWDYMVRMSMVLLRFCLISHISSLSCSNSMF